jgi:D-alanyl-D-alanine carboxypeptidase (penicillin-binding protein 5/6)
VVLTSRRVVAALLAALCMLVFTSMGASAQPGASCPNRAAPPQPVDTSESPKPGQPSPGPVPVPDEPVGGSRMGECGVITPPGTPPPPADVTTMSWLVADLDNGDVLGAKDPHARHRPASLIKVLLAIVVLDELKMDTVVTGSQEDADQDGTRVGIGAGGQYTVRQLFFSLLMRSGNDCAHALAMRLGGVQQAVAKMNATAKKLGALDTQVATPSGLDGPGMMTSSYDLALFYQEAMKHPEFAEAVRTKQIDLPGYGDKPGFKVNNDNKLLGEYPGFLGGKTGFTNDARHTYLGGAEQNKHRLVVVLMRGEQTPVKMTDQGGHLFTWGFGLYKGKVEPVGKLTTSHTPQTRNSDAGGEAADSNTAASSPSAKGGAMRGALPTVAMSISAATVLGFIVWRIRRRYASAAVAAAPETDPEITTTIDPIRE